MHSTIFSALAGACLVAVTMANPIDSPTPQINSGCAGSIVNLFSFPSNSCNSNDTSASPFFYNQKIAAVEGQTTGCIRVNTPGYSASSFVYTRDGVENDSCELRTYRTTDCRDEYRASYDIDEDVSGCIVTKFRAVKLAC